MNRCFLPVLGWLLLTAAGPLPELAPPAPRLGEPFVARYPLPEPGLTLSGLPALPPLELLAPPRTGEGELRLYLVAMRPGAVRIPALLLESETGTRVETAAVELQVASGLAGDSTIAPFKSLPSPPPAPARRWWPLLLLLLGGGLAVPVLVRRWRRPQPASPGDAEELLLARLQRQLEAAPGAADPAWRQLREELLRLRFAPGPRPPQAVARLAEKVALHTGAAAP